MRDDMTSDEIMNEVRPLDEGGGKKVMAALSARFGTPGAMMIFAKHLRSQAESVEPSAKPDLMFIADELDRLAGETHKRYIR